MVAPAAGNVDPEIGVKRMLPSGIAFPSYVTVPDTMMRPGPPSPPQPLSETVANPSGQKPRKTNWQSVYEHQFDPYHGGPEIIISVAGMV